MSAAVTAQSYPDVASITTVTCIGAGTIGGGWAAYFLAQGYTVRVWDPAPDAAEKLTRLIDAAWPALAELDMVAGADRHAWTVHTDLAEAVAGTGFVQESAPEDLELKRSLLASIDAVCDEHVVIGSSTSGYSMTEMAVDARHPERLVVGHPFNPPYLIPLVEVVGGESTAVAAVDWAAEFYTRIGKSVIRMDHEVPGFIANRLQEAQWREALHMIDHGEATVEQIDRSITDGPGLRWPFQGPMLTFHLAGGEGGMAHMLDHFGPSLKSPWTRLDAPELTQKLRDDVVAGCEVASGDKTIPDLIATRDAGIIALRRLTAELEAADGTQRRITSADASEAERMSAETELSGQPEPRSQSQPIELGTYRTQVISDWIDYNGHMSEAFYVLIFGFATDQVMDQVGLGQEHREAHSTSLYTVESHIRYLDEVGLGAQVEVIPTLVSAGSKKMHLAYEMRAAGQLVATEEIIAVHVDQNSGAAAPFPNGVLERLRMIAHASPDWVGRKLG